MYFYIISKGTGQQSVVQPTHSPYSSPVNSNNVYKSQTYSPHSHSSHQPSAISGTSHASEQKERNANHQTSLQSQQLQNLKPLSQKIYSSVNSAHYSTSHVIPQHSITNYNSNPSDSNGQQYKTASNLNRNIDEAKDQRSSDDKYGKIDDYRQVIHRIQTRERHVNCYQRTVNLLEISLNR